MKLIVLLVPFIFLCGCVSPAERKAAWMENAKATCSAAGFRKGSDEYSRCVIARYNHAEADHAARVQSAMDQLNRLANPPHTPVTICNQTALGQVICTTQ